MKTLSLRCPEPNCGAAVVGASGEECKKCSKPVDETFLKRYVRANERLEAFTTARPVDKRSPMDEEAPKVLSECQGLVHPAQVSMLRLAAHQFDRAVDEGQWDRALSLGREVLEGYRLHYPPVCVHVCQHLLKMVKLSHVVNDGQTEAPRWGAEAREMAIALYGKDHYFVKVVVAGIVGQ